MKKNDLVKILRTGETGVVESIATLGVATVATVSVNGVKKTYAQNELQLVGEKENTADKFRNKVSNGKIQVKVVNKSKFTLPTYAKPGDAGMDLRANIKENIVLKPLERAVVPTGIYIQLPEGYEAQIRPRSGLAVKHGLSVLNTPGTVDGSYRGEIKVIAVNLSNEPFTIERGERIAQMVVNKFETVDWTPVEVLDDTERGANGFGSTGEK